MDNFQKRNFILIAVLVAVIIVGYFVFSSRQDKSLPVPFSTSTPQETATTTIFEAGEVSIEGTGDFIVTEVPLGQEIIPAPDLNQNVIFRSGLTSETKTAVLANINNTRREIAINPNGMNLWLKLAVYYKIAGDFFAAEEVWIYVTKRAPSSFVAFYNLGELYAYDLKDYLKAEANYRTALTKDPNQTSVYRAMYDFYRYATGQDGKARAILEEGIAQNPSTSQDLKYLLDHYDEV